MSDDTQKTSGDNRGMENLTEVLRLQAEALSRISERMASMPGPGGGGGAPLMALPPRHEPGGSHGLPVLAEDPVLSDESLPVLTAFRKFIDAERRRARIRLIWASIAFVILLTGVLAAVAVVGRAKTRELKADIQAAREQADQVRVSADTELKKVSDVTVNLKTDLSRGLQAAQSNVVNQMGTRDAELEKLKDTISTLEIDNAMLVGKLKDIGERTEKLNTAYETQAQQMQSFSDAMQPPPPTVGPVATPPASAAAPTGISVPVTPQVQFRLPAVP